MPWSFDIRECSAGCYKVAAHRNTGQSITKEGFECVIEELLTEVYKEEVNIGSTESKALYDITLAFLDSHWWEGEYFTGTFGSWSITNRADSNKSIHYDGRDFYLMISKEADNYSWQGELKQLSKGRCHYFRQIVYL